MVKALICPLWQCQCVCDAYIFILTKTKNKPNNRAQRQHMMPSCTSCSLSGRQLQVSFVRPQITDSSQSHREPAELDLAKQSDKCDDDRPGEWEQRERGWGVKKREAVWDFGETVWIILMLLLCWSVRNQYCAPEDLKNWKKAILQTHWNTWCISHGDIKTVLSQFLNHNTLSDIVIMIMFILKCHSKWSTDGHKQPGTVVTATLHFVPVSVSQFKRSC